MCIDCSPQSGQEQTILGGGGENKNSEPSCDGFDDILLKTLQRHALHSIRYFIQFIVAKLQCLI